MRHWFRDLDELLRGSKTVPQMLAAGGLELRLRRFIPLAILLGAAYGFFMGWYSVIGRKSIVYEQVIASMIKIPALFLITLVVTFPSLYVFNALLGSRMSFTQTLRLLVAAIVVNLTVAASLGPILGFFTLSTTSYPFMIILNVILMSLAGCVGLGFLMQTLRRISAAKWMQPPPVVIANGEEGETAELVTARPAEETTESRQIFRIWVLIYGLVGAQTSWLLRPFIGSPDLEFTWFRHREGNFFLSVWQHLQALLAGG